MTHYTDAELIELVDALGEEILATSSGDHYFERLCIQQDGYIDELIIRGLWQS